MARVVLPADMPMPWKFPPLRIWPQPTRHLSWSMQSSLHRSGPSLGWGTVMLVYPPEATAASKLKSWGSVSSALVTDPLLEGAGNDEEHAQLLSVHHGRC